MGSEGNSTAGLSSEAATPTTEELISQLRSSFFPAEFQNVTKKLMEREEDLKQKYIKLEKQAEEEKGLLCSENLKLADELKKKQKELDELRKENLEFKDQIKVLSSGKFRVENELKKKQSEIEAIRKQNAELARKVRVYEKRSSDFDLRVLSLEKIAKELMDSGSSSINLENKQQKTSAPENSRPPLFSKTKDANKRTEPKFQEMIHIDDDEEETISTLKRKQVSKEIKREFNSDDDDLKVISTLKRTRVSKEIEREHNREYELQNQPMTSPPVSTPHSSKISPFLDKIEPKNFHSSLDSSDSSSDSDDERVKEAYWSSLAKIKKDKERWKVEADMIKDFEKDDELCLNGICALQRRKIIVHGSDTSRIASLARLLIDGDPQSKLTKTASDLTLCDLDNCRMFARKYSLQLFNIYQEQKDPFFPPRR